MDVSPKRSTDDIWAAGNSAIRRRRHGNLLCRSRDTRQLVCCAGIRKDGSPSGVRCHTVGLSPEKLLELELGFAGRKRSRAGWAILWGLVFIYNQHRRDNRTAGMWFLAR
jgi:hypothetical protein